MMQHIKILSGTLLLILMIILLFQPTEAATCPEHITTGAALGIEAVPAWADSEFQAAFCKYTKVIAPNGESIHIFSQDQVTNEQVVRSRRILEFFLEDVPGSTYGTDKSAVVNQMTVNNATLILLNGEHDGTNPAEDLDGQPLFAEEMPVEGSPAYINNDYGFRDAAFEEILHLMQDTGIGVDGEHNTQPGILPAYQVNIRAAMNNANLDGFRIWPIGADGTNPETESSYRWIVDNNNDTQEYLAAAVDSYYGYWGAYTEQPGGMWGMYIAKTRAEMAVDDPMGYALMEDFFNPYVTYMARIDSSFNGTFSLAFDAAMPYTHKSQYLLNARLTGSNSSNLNGNDQDNQLQGNAGNNLLTGNGGSDVAIFVGNRSEYSITSTDDSETLTVTDNVADRDGVDTLQSVERLQFADGTILAEALSDGTTGETADETVTEDSTVYLPLILQWVNSLLPSPTAAPSPTATSSPAATPAPTATPTTPPSLATFSVGPLPAGLPSAFNTAFTKHISVFGIPIFADADTPDNKVLHTAHLMAQYLDNDEDGAVDNPPVLENIIENQASIVMFNLEGTDAEQTFFDTRPDDFFTQLLHGVDTRPNGSGPVGFDIALEETLHLVTQQGYGEAYPDVWGEDVGTAVGNAMDIARGGRFLEIPESYPESAWFHYDDETCDYGCQIVEYTYWAFTSILGAQDYEGRLAKIEHEWELNTRELVETRDPAIYALLTDPIYKLPTRLPDGKYDGQ